MINASQKTVFEYFTGQTGKVSLAVAVQAWQADKGYIHPSVTLNWMAIAQDNGIKYLGDIDMQNGIATGAYTIDSGGQFEFTLTAGTLSVITGYNPSFTVGSISAEPIAGHSLSLFYSRSDDHTTTIQFSGDVTGDLAGLVLSVNGTPVPYDTPFTYDGTPGIDASVAGWNSELFTAETDYLISWS